MIKTIRKPHFITTYHVVSGRLNYPTDWQFLPIRRLIIGLCLLMMIDVEDFIQIDFHGYNTQDVFKAPTHIKRFSLKSRPWSKSKEHFCGDNLFFILRDMKFHDSKLYEKIVQKHNFSKANFFDTFRLFLWIFFNLCWAKTMLQRWNSSAFIWVPV